MSKKKSGKSKGNAPDKDQMLMYYIQPNITLADVSRKFKLTERGVYHFSNKYNWSDIKKKANETALLEATNKFIKKRKNVLFDDLEKISGIEDKIFKKLDSKEGIKFFTVAQMCMLIKLKYELLSQHGTGKDIINNNIQEGDNILNFNISDTVLDTKIINLVDDMKGIKTISNRVKVLEKGKGKK
jgi:hypothetical protein